MAASGTILLEVDAGEIRAALGQDRGETDTYEADSGANGFLESLSLPYEQEGSALARLQLMEALSGKQVVKTLGDDGVEALVTVDADAGTLEVFAVNTREYQVVVELVVRDQEGRKLDADQVSALIHTASKEELTEEELERYLQADHVDVEVLEPVQTGASIQQVFHGPAAGDEAYGDLEEGTEIPGQEEPAQPDQAEEHDEDHGEPLDAYEDEVEDRSQQEPDDNTGGQGDNGGLLSHLPAMRLQLLRAGGNAAPSQPLGDQPQDNGEADACWAVVSRETTANADVRDNTVTLGLPARGWAALTVQMPLMQGDQENDGFQVAYDLGEGMGVAPVDHKLYGVGTHAQVLAPPVELTPPDGMQFAGWQVQGAGPVHYPYSMIAVSGPLTLKARYVDVGDVVTLTYFSNGGDGNPISITAKQGETVPLMGTDAFSRHGFVQIGWSQDSEGGADYPPDGAIDMEYDTHLYAVWEPGKLTVTFVAGQGGSLDGDTSFSVSFGADWSQIQVPALTAEEGYCFLGWTPGLPDIYDPITDDCVYSAVFVEQLPLTIQANSDSKPYNGETHTIDGYSTNLPDGYSITGLTVTGQGTDAGTHPVTITLDTQEYAIRDSWGYPVTQLFGTPVLVDGRLEIMPAPLTISADDMTVPVGSPVPAFTLEYSGWVGGDTPDVLDVMPEIECTYSQDSPAGSYTIDLDGAQARNYNIVHVAGTLTVVGDDEGGTPGGNGGGSSGGGDGGSTGGGSTGRIPGGGTRIPDLEIPLSIATIQEEEIPLQEIFTIYDNPVPVGSLPSAGGIPIELVIPLGALLVCAAGVRKLRGRKQQHMDGTGSEVE